MKQVTQALCTAALIAAGCADPADQRALTPNEQEIVDAAIATLEQHQDVIGDVVRASSRINDGSRNETYATPEAQVALVNDAVALLREQLNTGRIVVLEPGPDGRYDTINGQVAAASTNDYAVDAHEKIILRYEIDPSGMVEKRSISCMPDELLHEALHDVSEFRHLPEMNERLDAQQSAEFGVTGVFGAAVDTGDIVYELQAAAKFAINGSSHPEYRIQLPVITDTDSPLDVQQSYVKEDLERRWSVYTYQFYQNGLLSDFENSNGLDGDSDMELLGISHGDMVNIIQENRDFFRAPYTEWMRELQTRAQETYDIDLRGILIEARTAARTEADDAMHAKEIAELPLWTSPRK